MTDRLAILVPSRGRPQKFYTLVETWIANSSGCSDLILRNGDADPLAHTYESFVGLPNLIRVVGPDDGFPMALHGNAGYNPAQQDLYERFPDYAAYWCLEDDCEIHTPNFDANLLAALAEFPGRLGVVEAWDRARTIQALCMSDVWCKTLGYLHHPEVGEQGFLLTRSQAQAMGVLNEDMRGRCEYTHRPLLAGYGYHGSERPGALTSSDTVTRFYAQGNWLKNEWAPRNWQREINKLTLALRKVHGDSTETD